MNGYSLSIKMSSRTRWDYQSKFDLIVRRGFSHLQSARNPYPENSGVHIALPSVAILGRESVFDPRGLSLMPHNGATEKWGNGRNNCSQFINGGSRANMLIFVLAAAWIQGRSYFAAKDVDLHHPQGAAGCCAGSTAN